MNIICLIIGVVIGYTLASYVNYLVMRYFVENPDKMSNLSYTIVSHFVNNLSKNLDTEISKQTSSKPNTTLTTYNATFSSNPFRVSKLRNGINELQDTINEMSERNK